MKFVIKAFVSFVLFTNFAYACDREYVEGMNEIIVDTRENVETIVAENMPTSIVIAQAVLETGYGKSRAAKVQNNHFGMMSRGSIMTYDSVEENVQAYFVNLSNHNAYRDLRSELEQNEKSIRNILASYTHYYAEDPEYTNKLLSVINSCQLLAFDQENQYYANR